MKYWLILPLAFCLTITSCKQQEKNENPEEKAPVAATEPLSDENSADVSVLPSEAPAVEQKAEARPAPRQQAKPAATAAKPKAAAPAKPKGKAETIYVETEGAQGRVWGHVTMKGDRGTGTIHDWDENTLTVTVTRHGNELYAVDQNSRQYVFRLKK